MKKLVTTQTADIGLSSLNAENVRRVQGWFNHLKNWDNDAYVRGRSHKLDEVPGVYILLTNTDLRIFFRIDGDTVTVLSIASKATILASGRIP
jgi:hypothetical protein